MERKKQAHQQQQNLSSSSHCERVTIERMVFIHFACTTEAQSHRLVTPLVSQLTCERRGRQTQILKVFSREVQYSPLKISIGKMAKILIKLELKQCNHKEQ